MRILDVEVRDRQRVLLDELAARLDDVAHELDEEVVGVGRVLDLDLQERAHLAVERRLPELLRRPLAEALVALHLQALAAEARDRVEERQRAVDRRLLALAKESRGLGVDVLQRAGALVELARLLRTEERRVEDGGLPHAAHGAAEDVAAVAHLAGP